jgi:hypothetical protein
VGHFSFTVLSDSAACSNSRCKLSAPQQDYKVILSRPSAMAEFERLYSSGNIMAKCYALVGIHRLSPQRFRELARPLHNSKEQAVTMHGCLMSYEPLGVIINQIESGRYWY